MENKQKWPETKAGKSALVGQCSGSGSEKSEEHGEPSGFRVEHLLESILKTYERLKELGFTYYNGKIVVIDTEEVSHE